MSIIINLLPDEIIRNIYKYLNPITIPVVRKSKIIWCSKCGEVLKNGDWLLCLNDDNEHLFYECVNCLEEYYFTDPDIWDILLSQELGYELR